MKKTLNLTIRIAYNSFISMILAILFGKPMTILNFAWFHSNVNVKLKEQFFIRIPALLILECHLKQHILNNNNIPSCILDLGAMAEF